MELVASAPWTERLIAIARPYLQRLTDETGEAVGLTRIEGSICHVFYQITNSKFNVQVRDWTGGTFPLHVTSTGKLYLAYKDPAEVDAFLQSPLPKTASGTITTKRQMRREIKEVKRQGFAWTIDELEDGLTSIAVPLSDHSGRFLAGVYVSAPSYRFTHNGERDRLRDLTVRTGRDICRQLEKLGFVVQNQEEDDG
jgi:DNA-binding IclR family transcriptional regulator